LILNRGGNILRDGEMRQKLANFLFAHLLADVADCENESTF
jgi:hypothetical protein